MRTLLCSLLVCLSFSFVAAQKISTIQFEGKKFQVLDLTALGRVTWGGYEEIGDAVKSETDGVTNTRNIIKAVGKNPGYNNKPYAAILCDTSTAGGFTDWYLPAKNESDMIHANFAKLGLDEKMTIWTSTEASGTQAVTKYFYSGAFYNSQKVDDNHYVCIRKAN